MVLFDKQPDFSFRRPGYPDSSDFLSIEPELYPVTGDLNRDCVPAFAVHEVLPQIHQCKALPPTGSVSPVGFLL